MAFIGKTDNYHLPYLNPDEMSPYMYNKASDVITHMNDIQSTGLVPNQSYISPISQPPQLKIGATKVNQIYPEGSFGQSFLKPFLTSSSDAPVVPAYTTFRRESYNTYY